MISCGTILTASDNSGAKDVCCIRILGGSGQKYGKIGDVIIASVKSVKNSGNVKVGDVVRCLIVRTKANFRRSNGFYIRFNDNSVVLIDQDGKMRGTRVFGMIPRGIGDGCVSEKMRELLKSISSLAPMIV